jgi:hypothetical protein
MRPIEVSQVVDGEVKADQLVAIPQPGSVPGPDVIVGDLSGLAQFGSADGTKVGLAVGTDSCNFGTTPLNWFALPSNDHPVIPQNLYRMSGGVTNDERFEQIGQSNVKHAFTALANNICNLGCQSPGTGTLLGSGCSDPYSAIITRSGRGRGSTRSLVHIRAVIPPPLRTPTPDIATPDRRTGSWLIAATSALRQIREQPIMPRDNTLRRMSMRGASQIRASAT